MATFTVRVQRINTRGTAWRAAGEPQRIKAPDAEAAAFSAVRNLRVLPKVERLLLWEGVDTSTSPRIFHPGS
jgi:hypothetical protein